MIRFTAPIPFVLDFIECEDPLWQEKIHEIQLCIASHRFDLALSLSLELEQTLANEWLFYQIAFLFLCTHRVEQSKMYLARIYKLIEEDYRILLQDWISLESSSLGSSILPLDIPVENHQKDATKSAFRLFSQGYYFFVQKNYPLALDFFVKAFFLCSSEEAIQEALFCTATYSQDREMVHRISQMLGKEIAYLASDPEDTYQEMKVSLHEDVVELLYQLEQEQKKSFSQEELFKLGQYFLFEGNYEKSLYYLEKAKEFGKEEILFKPSHSS